MDEITQTLLEYKSIVVGVWLVLLFFGERLVPSAERVGGWTRVLRNAGLWGVNIGLSLAIIVPLSRWATDSALDWRPDWFDGLLSIAIDIVILDFLIYWWHRANHVVPVLWRFHQVHHLDEFLDVTSSVRFHFGEVLLSACFWALIILALDMPLASVLAFEGVVLLAAAFQHSNLSLAKNREKAISGLLITPSIHWVHHHAVRDDTDSNYGTIFSFWDPLFGSRSPTSRTPEMKMGVESRSDVNILALLIRPFQRQD
ncbi:MAG: sterol desaturase family protein [Alphaproteobacteria bacterium]|jgi:sterol desaturase/sphingolipid hydroxylase (fatty acid hydroxylase superfamily)|nr:sterol desaturase family protein [Alphaproteobacteria bacterium]